MATVTGVPAAPGVTVASPDMAVPQGAALVPFRRATLRKTEQGSSLTGTIAANSIPLNDVLEGTGFLESVDLFVDAVTAGNAAAVAYAADAPWSALSSVVFKDVGPDLINVSGYALFLANLYGGYGLRNPALSTDTNIYQLISGGGATGGSFRYHLRLPLAINDRSLIGLLGNQDRAVKYETRTDLASSASIYTTAPTNPATFQVRKFLQFATVPSPLSADRKPQEQIPPYYGVIHLLNELRSEAAPVSNSTVNHFLRSIGNTIRYIVLVLRDSTGARSDAMLPSRITFRVGSEPVFSETGAHRRKLMYDRYGFDAPAGVLVYDFIRDFTTNAGFELGDDWLNTQAVANAQFEVSYPTFASTPGTLNVITDSLVIPSGLDINAYV